MSLEYKKRLMELRRYAEQELNPNSDGISTKPKKSIVKKRKENKMDQLRLDYVVQWHNYREMIQFVEMFTKPPFDGIDKIHFSMITDWLTWERDEFMKMAIWHENHTEHENFLRVLSSDVFDNSKVSLTNLAAYRK